jgi:hypothetical protein
MDLDFSIIKNGVNVKCNKKNFRLIYPEKIWKKYYDKETLMDNLAYLLTINLPFVSKSKEINYNTSLPLFNKEFNEMVRKGIPGAVEDYKKIKTKKVFKQFENTKYNFSSRKIKKPRYNGSNNDRVVISLSMGKDSLLSLGLCDELGLKPVIVHIDDTVSPTENSLKLRIFKQMNKEYSGQLVTNEIEKLNDFETGETPESCLGYMHMLTGFCFISLPIVNHFKASWIVLGNEKNLDYKFINKDGVEAYPSFDQSLYWTKKMNKMINKITNDKVGVFSVLQPLHDIMLLRILHKRYPELAKHQVSCPCLDASDEKRWCHECSTCTFTYLGLLANDIDPKTVGFHKNLLNRKYKGYYSLFGGKKADAYGRTEEAREEELLYFYLAYRNNVKGKLIDKFKKKFLKEATSREDELYKRFFKIYSPETVPKKFRKQLLSIYKEELKNI